MNTIDAQLLAKMFLAGAKNLESKKEWINELNVFPVPDGDTGTNMTMTIMSAAREVLAIENPTFETLAKAISSGSLRGARGNSGVILSQLFRGFTRVIAEVDEITVPVMALAFEKATETAYKAVMKPKEGTILTVAKGAATKATELSTAGCTDMSEFLAGVIEHATYVLSQTPEMLPVLKQAGVVDSGGQGFVEVLTGWYDAFLGKEIDYQIMDATPIASTMTMSSESEAEIKFGYCTEFIVMLSKAFNSSKERDFKMYLESIGDSIVVVADDDIVKVHVHTNDPGLAIQKALTYGSLSNMKIDNMRLEHEEKLIKEAEARAKEENTPKKEYGFIAVSIGEGMNEILSSVGVDYLIEGGQTMNPSTEDMLNAICKVHAETIFVLPNNSNIILAANQARDLTEDKNIIVIPTKTVAQGITAAINFVPSMSPEENEANMLEEITRVKTGSVTYAVRDTMIDDKEITCGDFMGICDSGILSVGTDMLATTLEMVDAMVDDDIELISIYYGSDVDSETAEELQALIEDKFSMCDVELQYGGQPIYYYVISAE